MLHHTRRKPGPAPQLVTARELQVVRLTAEGVRSKEIAQQLGISYKTVRTHLRRLYIKLDATNCAHLIAILFRRGMLQ